MAEKTIELKPVKIMYVCDMCGKGQMIASGLEEHGDSPLLLHQCSECGYIELFDVMYPRVEYLSK